MRPDDDLLTEFTLDPAVARPAEDGRVEPMAMAKPRRTEADGVAPLDKSLFGFFAQADTEETPRRRSAAITVAVSLGFHAAALLLLLTLLTSAPTELSGAIPVQLVIEASSGSSQPVQPTLSAAEDVPDTVEAPPAATARRPPPMVKVAAVVPPPLKPAAPRHSAAKPAAPVAAPQPQPAAAISLPEALPPAAEGKVAAKPAEAATGSAQPSPAAQASAAASAPAAQTGHGSYLDYLVALTKEHFDVLPLSFLAGRHGHAVLTVTVMEDGTIARIAVKQGSGYPDIDERIGRMVAAVGRFPPVPANFQKPSANLDFKLTFPDALQH